MGDKIIVDMVLIPPGSRELGSGGDYGATTSYQTVTGEIINVTRAGNKFEIQENPPISYVSIKELSLER
jgi:hypothetical protein